MPPPSSLQVIKEHAQQQADDAATRMRRFQEAWQQMQAKHGQLAGYQADYQNRLAQASRTGLSAPMLRDYYAFIARIDQAASLQQQETARAQLRYEEAQRQWLELTAKVKAYEKLEERQSLAALQQENRREQKASDERASRGSNPFGGD